MADIVAMAPPWARRRPKLSTKYAGPVAWAMLHGIYNSLCEGGHFTSNPAARPLMLRFLSNFARAFPCIYCRRSIPGFVNDLTAAFQRGDKSTNLMRDLHNRVNKKLYDQAHSADQSVRENAIASGGLLKTPNYSPETYVHHKVEDSGWDVCVRHFIMYCASRIHDSHENGADGLPEGDRAPRLTDMVHDLNEFMRMLQRPPIRPPTSMDDLVFPTDAPPDHLRKYAQMMKNLISAFRAP